ncbi:yddA protein [Escherichia coli DEC11E]|nr:yddA protein [Escherichia coli DEC11E]
MKRGLRNGVAPYIPAAFCRDAGSAGHGATEAARPERLLQARGFASGMEARQGGDSSAGSVHDSPPRLGDARKRHKQENNKTDSNQSSRKKKNSSRNNIISNRQMTGLKRQKPTAERPRNERGGA